MARKPSFLAHSQRLRTTSSRIRVKAR